MSFVGICQRLVKLQPSHVRGAFLVGAEEAEIAEAVEIAGLVEPSCLDEARRILADAAEHRG